VPRDAPIPTPDLLQLDTDGDLFPDFIEDGTGYDRDARDCELAAGCGEAGGVDLTQQSQDVLFILDSSGSMAGQIKGIQKMAIAKQALKRYVEQVPENARMGLLVYGHQGDNSAEGKAASCGGVEILYPIGSIDKESFGGAIDSFEPKGWTPIASSLQKAQKALATLPDGEKHIILVSDGEETCGGDPCQVAQEIAASGVNLLIDVIGFHVNAQTRQQLECIAREGGGIYIDARSSEELDRALDRINERISSALDVRSCLQRNFYDFAECLDAQFSASIQFLADESARAQKEGNKTLSIQLTSTKGALSSLHAQLKLLGLNATLTDIDSVQAVLDELYQSKGKSDP